MAAVVNGIFLKFSICGYDSMQLSAAYNQISDMTGVGMLCNLTVLNLSNNNITSINCMYCTPTCIVLKFLH